MFKYLLVLATLFLVACSTETPTATVVGTPEPNASATPEPAAETPVERIPESLAELDITATTGSVSFKSPELKEGQWAQYRVTSTDGADVQVNTRAYSILTFYYRSDPCIGIERNSTIEGEFRTRTMWCQDNKYVYVWNEKRQAFNEPQLLDSDAHWSDEAVQGFSTTKFDGLEKVTVDAGTFWTVPKTVYNGLATKNVWHSPLVPGFEAGLVKKVEIVNPITTTTELVAYGGIE